MGSGAMARGKTGNIAGSGEENVKHVLRNQRPKNVIKTPEKRLKFHNVFFDKVMEMKEVQAKKEMPTKSSRSKKRKATNELVIKEYNPARKKNEPLRRKYESVKEEPVNHQGGNSNRVPATKLQLDLQASTGPLDLRTRVREDSPESATSSSDSPGLSTSTQSSPESTPSSTLRLSSPPPLEPLPTQLAPPSNSAKVRSRPFAEGFMWHLLCQLRQEAPKARKEGKATVPSG